MALASDSDINDFLASHPQWMLEGDELATTATLKDFNEAMALVNRIAAMAEEANHHPDIAISWNKVSLRLSTHSEGGITSKDLELAAQLPLA